MTNPSYSHHYLPLLLPSSSSASFWNPASDHGMYSLEAPSSPLPNIQKPESTLAEQEQGLKRNSEPPLPPPSARFSGEPIQQIPIRSEPASPVQAPPSAFTEANADTIVNTLGMALINIQPQVKKRLMMKRQENGAPHIPNEALYSLLQRPDEKEPPHVDPSSPQQLERIIDVYCLMTSFMTIYLLFIEILLQDLMDGHAHTFEGYMQLFSVQDDVFYHQDDMFIWYYLYARKETSILHDIRTSIRKTGIQFRSLTLVDTIFSRFYTHHFLELAAQKHQKDHGQFYTPQSVVQFMWNRCLDKQQLMQSASAGHVPRVFDPCMGIGSFLCEFLARQVESCSVIWNHADVLLRLLTTVIPQHVWAVEIDPFAHHLGKLNVMVHLFPFYRRLIELKTPLTQRMIDRLRLFRNDTLKLDTTLPNMDAWEQHQLHRLRDATELKFDYIVTNPPYMIRKTGFITVPDAALYDERVLGGRGTQAYLYFMWICLQRIDDHHGQLCLITPSQWMVLEFAEHLRLWIWKHCKLLEVFQFEPYKVWRKVQTDSLIFLLCKRSFIPRQGHTNTHATLFLRHLSRRIGLEAILHSYEAFDRLIPYTQDPSIASKIVPTDPLDRIHESPHASFAFLYPSTSVSDQLMKSTAHFPRLCDGESRLSDVASTHIPLIWNRGPNTNPVYALVVRTSWAIRTFGQACCDRWLRPVFYWNGKSSARTGKETSVSKEVAFWHNRDSGRLTKKENSPAEAYAPFCRKDPEAGDSFFSFYSLILVDKEGAEELETDQRTLGEKATTCALYHYLKEARQALQPTKNDRTLAWCHYNKCGLQIPVKIVHPINFGYFSRTQPRQRFFVDRTSQCVTNQCIYFTIKPDSPWQSADYFCGLLNSSTIQYFIRAHCYYDQQGRTRFFGKNMSKIPFAPPIHADDVDTMAAFVQDLTVTRLWIYEIIEKTRLRTVMDKVRNCMWDISTTDQMLLKEYEKHQGGDWWWDRDPHSDHWVDAKIRSMRPRSITLCVLLTRLLMMASLLQCCIDHLTYFMYGIPPQFQKELELELELSLTETWYTLLGDDVYLLEKDREKWQQKMTFLLRSLCTDGHCGASFATTTFEPS